MEAFRLNLVSSTRTRHFRTGILQRIMHGALISNSHISCCISKCHQKKTVEPNGQKVGVFGFAKDKYLKKAFISNIRREEGDNFVVTDDTKVCSLHFDPSEVKKGFGGKMALKC